MSDPERVLALVLLAGLLWLGLSSCAGSEIVLSADQRISDSIAASEGLPRIAVDGQGRVCLDWRDGQADGAETSTSSSAVLICASDNGLPSCRARTQLSHLGKAVRPTVPAVCFESIFSNSMRAIVVR